MDTLKVHNKVRFAESMSSQELQRVIAEMRFAVNDMIAISEMLAAQTPEGSDATECLTEAVVHLERAWNQLAVYPYKR